MLILAEYCRRLGIDFENLTFEATKRINNKTNRTNV